MKRIDEKQLKTFAQEEHKKYKRQAITEGVVALLPIVALATGFIVIYNQPNSGELMAPQRLGLISVLMPVVVAAYLVFLFFVIKDMRKKLKQK